MYTPHKLNISVLWNEDTLWGIQNPEDHTDDPAAAETRYEKMLTDRLTVEYPDAALEIEKREFDHIIASVNGMVSSEPAYDLQDIVEDVWKTWFDSL